MNPNADLPNPARQAKIRIIRDWQDHIVRFVTVYVRDENIQFQLCQTAHQWNLASYGLLTRIFDRLAMTIPTGESERIDWIIGHALQLEIIGTIAHRLARDKSYIMDPTAVPAADVLQAAARIYSFDIEAGTRLPATLTFP